MDLEGLPLFDGISLLEPLPRAAIDLPHLPEKTASPTALESAAARRLEGARRSRPAPRNRIGPTRDLAQAEVLAFPLCRNAKAVSAMIERVPLAYGSDLASICDREARKLEKRLVYRGINKKSARRCAMDLLHEVYMKRVLETDRRP